MARYVLSPSARNDVFDLIEYLSARNPTAAIRFRDRLFVTFKRLAEFPGLGHVRDDLAPKAMTVRFLPIGRYLVVYRDAPSQVEIVRVLSGYRDVWAILDRE